VKKMLSKKNYKVFAKLIGESQTLQNFTDKLTNYLAEENLRFDQTRFSEAIEKTKREE
jgi:hypothetical protein